MSGFRPSDRRPITSVTLRKCRDPFLVHCPESWDGADPILHRRPVRPGAGILGLAFAAERQGIIPSARQVLSFKGAPVLGAAIAVENIEVMDFEVIVHITGQLHRQVRDMPPGSRITGFTVAPPPSQPEQG
jgi:hypothetical protein